MANHDIRKNLEISIINLIIMDKKKGSRDPEKFIEQFVLMIKPHIYDGCKGIYNEAIANGGNDKYAHDDKDNCNGDDDDSSDDNSNDDDHHYHHHNHHPRDGNDDGVDVGDGDGDGGGDGGGDGDLGV